MGFSGGPSPWGGLSGKSLRFALAAAGQGASGLHATLLYELMAPSVIGVEPKATAPRFSSGRVGHGHNHFYDVDSSPGTRGGAVAGGIVRCQAVTDDRHGVAASAEIAVLHGCTTSGRSQ